MPRGMPDYENPEYMVGQAYTDPALLTLASLHFTSIDGKGRPIYVDAFGEGLLNWVTATGGGVGVIGATTANAYISPASALLQPAAGNPAANAYMYREVSAVTKGRFGVEFAYQTDTVAYVLTAALVAYRDRTRCYAGMQINVSDQHYYIFTSTGTVEIDGSWNNLYHNDWVRLKLVVDVDNYCYHRAVIWGEEFSLRDYKITPYYDPRNASVHVGFTAVNNLATPGTGMRIGYVLVTSDEP